MFVDWENGPVSCPFLSCTLVFGHWFRGLLMVWIPIQSCHVFRLLSLILSPPRDFLEHSPYLLNVLPCVGKCGSHLCFCLPRWSCAVTPVLAILCGENSLSCWSCAVTPILAILCGENSLPCWSCSVTLSWQFCVVRTASGSWWTFITCQSNWSPWRNAPCKDSCQETQEHCLKAGWFPWEAGGKIVDIGML